MPDHTGIRPWTVNAAAIAAGIVTTTLIATASPATPITLMGPEAVITPDAGGTESIDRRPIVGSPAESAAQDPAHELVGTTIEDQPINDGLETGSPSEAAAEPSIKPDTIGGFLMAGGIVVITFILMARLRRGKHRTAPSTASPSEQIAAIRARAGDRNSIEAYKADAHDFTRRMAAVLDNKAERLEQLIADADERLAALHGAEQTDAGPHRFPGQQTGHAPPHADNNTGRSNRPAQSTDPLHDKIYLLADTGLDPVAIARETGQPTGQVELILALRA